MLHQIPTSLFTDFNKTEEEMDTMSIYHNMSAFDYDANGKPIDDDNGLQ